MSAAASSSALSPLTQLVGWYFLPSFLAGLLLRVYYLLFPSLRPIPPLLPPRPPNDPPSQPIIVDPETHVAAQRHRKKVQRDQRWARVVVVGVYLLWGLYSTYAAQRGTNFYHLLGLPSNSVMSSLQPPTSPLAEGIDIAIRKNGKGPVLLDESGLKAHWRALARRYHPDKIVLPSGLPPSSAEAYLRAAHTRFLHLRLAYETLSSPEAHWAYDRFGVVVAEEWGKEKAWKGTERQAIVKGVGRSAAPVWVVTVGMMALLGLFRRNHPETFWRFWITLVAIVWEARLLLSPSSSPPPLLAFLFPDRTTHQLVLLIRQLSLTLCCAVTHLGPLFTSPEDAKKRPQAEEERWKQTLKEVEAVSSVVKGLEVQIARGIMEDAQAVVETCVRREWRKRNGGEGEDEKAIRQRVTSEAVQRVKMSMLDVLCDRQLITTPEGRVVWENAVKRAGAAVDSNIDEFSSTAAVTRAEEAVKAEDAYQKAEARTAAEGSQREVKEEPVTPPKPPVSLPRTDDGLRLRTPKLSAGSEGSD